MKESYIKCKPKCNLTGFKKISYTTSLSEKTITNLFLNDKSGFISAIENAGCTGEVLTQENHILSPKGGSGSIYPKNIVIRTDGSGNTFGSFFRDDTLTNVKGDVRGSGANDLSVSRNLCSQVASGAFSSILSGQNNTASGEGSLIIGGNSNIADSSNCIVIGGNNNRSGGGFNNAIVTGINNTNTQLRNNGLNKFLDISNSLIVTGSNLIMNGKNNVFITGNDISGSPITPAIDSLPFSGCAVITGNRNTFLPVTSFADKIEPANILIGTGINNKPSYSTAILTGNNYTTDTFSFEAPNIVYSGRNLNISPAQNITINSAYLSVDTTRNESIQQRIAFLPGSNNFIRLFLGYDSAIGGMANSNSGSNTAIVTGSNNETVQNSSALIESIICTGNSCRGPSFPVWQRGGIITGSNHSVIFTSTSNIGAICGMMNSNTTGLGSILHGGGSNNICRGNSSSVISGTNNSITTASNSVIGAGFTGTINGAFTNSFMTGIAGLLSTPVVTSAAVFGQSNLQGATGTPSSNRLFMIGNGSGTRRNAFSVTENGVVRAQRVFATGGADFAEFFESYQGSEKLPLHESVCLIDDRFLGKKIENGSLVSSEDGFKENDLGKIILSSQLPDEIEAFGVVTNNSSYIGNSYDEEWQGKYQKDEHGNFIYIEEDKIEYEDVFDISSNEIVKYIEEKRISENGEIYYQIIKQIKLEEIKIPVTEEISVYDEHGQLLRTITEPKKNKIITKVKTKKISEIYNTNQIYIPRKFRPEWNLIGLRGQVLIKKGQRHIPNSIKIDENNKLFDKYLI
jgi:hypothetical protein